KPVTSRDNPIVKQLSALTKSASARRTGGMCLLEGEHLAQSYVQNGRRLAQLVLRAESSNANEVSIATAHRALANAADETILLSPAIFDSLSSLATPSGVLAIASVPSSSALTTSGFVLALDRLQDPGNVGTLIRTAAAAGASQVWLSQDCAFAWSTKTLRASQGAHFHIDVIEAVDLAAALNAFNGECWATLPRPLDGMRASVRVQPLANAKFGADVALILSNEGAGLSHALYDTVTHGLSIPMARGIESLNVATAGAIALYGIAQQIAS
ncbi:MAG: TrmH family RNA methyltransferase, partial [Casimicrobium sp.]